MTKRKGAAVLLQRRPPRRAVAGAAVVITAFAAASAATMLLASAWFDMRTSAAGRPLALTLTDIGLKVGEAACCVLLAWAVWREGNK
jgi:hypothetical protein